MRVSSSPYWALIGALILAAYTLALGLIFHAYWLAPAADLRFERAIFFNHLSIIGGMLAIVAFGAGCFSLDAAMRRTGGHKPIWATEFGNQVDDARISASLLIRMLCMLSAAGVERAYWYALVDEPAYRNMGLYDSGSRGFGAGS